MIHLQSLAGRRPWRSGFLFFLFLAVLGPLAAAGTGCGLRAPEKPQWSVTLRMPLSQKTLRVSDLIAHNSGYLDTDADGTATLHWSEDLAGGTVGTSLVLASVGTDAATPLGAFQINPAPPPPVNVSLSDLWPQAVVLDGQTADVPALSFSPVESAQSSTFLSAQVQTGTLSVGLANHLPVPLSASTLVIANSGGGSVVGTLHFGALAPGESTSADLSLDGRTLTSSWSGTWSGTSPGSQGPVAVSAGASVRTAFAFRGPLVVSAAVAPLPAQNIEWSSSATLPDSEQLTGADFDAGSLDLSFDNRWGVSGSLRVTLPDFTGSDGIPLVRTVPLGAARTVTLSLPLAGARFSAGDPAHPAIRIQGRLSSDGTGTRNLTLSSSDSIAVHAELNSARFARVQGRFAPFHVSFVSVERAVQVPTGLGTLDLAAAGGQLTLTSTAGVPAHVVLQVSGTDAQGQPWSLQPAAGSTLSLDLPAAPSGGTASGTLSLSGVNSNLPEFLGHLPTHLNVTAYAEVGDAAQTSVVRSSDTFASHLDLSSALLAAFSESRISLDADSAHLSADARDRIRDRLTRVVLHARVTNGLPLGADATLYLGGRRSEVTAPGPSTVTLAASVAAGQVDPVSGAVSAPSTGEVTAELSGAQLDVLQHDPLLIGASVHLPGTGGRRVRVRAQDAVQARVWIEVEGKVNR